MTLAERNFKHGAAIRGSAWPEYVVWRGMRKRCELKTDKDYPRYGARGITVCPEWKDFLAFFQDMGRRPTPFHQIERRNNNGNYEPLNCYWATVKEQARNRRNSKLITAHGATMTQVEWSEITGVKQTTINYRLKAGWPPEKIFTKARRYGIPNP